MFGAIFELASAMEFGFKACIDNREKLVNQQYLLHMSSQYFNGFASRLGFVAASTSLNGGQPNFERCLAVSWAGYYISRALAS